MFFFATVSKYYRQHIILGPPAVVRKLPLAPCMSSRNMWDVSRGDVLPTIWPRIRILGIILLRLSAVLRRPLKKLHLLQHEVGKNLVIKFMKWKKNGKKWTVQKKKDVCSLESTVLKNREFMAISGHFQRF